MQTFLPFENFTETAKCLDFRRLNKQRVECLSILQCLSGKTTGWSNHPCTKMWRGYEWCLADYAITMSTEWIIRGYKDTCLGKFIEYSNRYKDRKNKIPWWLGWEPFHRSHRSNLLRKLPSYYCRYQWAEQAGEPYVWPSNYTESIRRSIFGGKKTIDQVPVGHSQ